MTAAHAPNLEDLFDQPVPAWLWDVDRGRICWGNRAALSFWREDSLLDLIEREFDPHDPTIVQLSRLATEFDEDRPLERNLEFDLADGRQWVGCKCYPTTLDDGRPGLLILKPAGDQAEIRFSRFGEMVEEAPVPMSLFSATGSLLFQNRETDRIVGTLFRDHGLGGLATDTEHTRGRDHALQLIARAVRSGTVSQTAEVATLHGRRTHRVTLKRVHDPDTDDQAFLLLLRDIGDRRSIGNAEQKEKERLQSLLNHVSDFQWRMNASLQFTHITGRFEQVTGLRRDQLVGKSWEQAVALFGLGPAPTLGPLLTEDTPWRNQDVLWPKSGDANKVLRLSLSALPRHDARGRFSGWHGIGRLIDAEERSRPQPASVAAPSRTATETVARDLGPLLESVTDGILMLNEQGKIIQANERARETLGDALEGQSLEDIVSEADQSRLRDHLKSLAAGGLVATYDAGLEVALPEPDGRPVLILIRPLGPDYAGAAFTVAVRDISLIKRAEAELRTALTQAQQANAQKSDFLASVAHELRTPLNAIIGFSEVMRDERYGELGSERYLSYASDIHDSGELLLSLINDLLDLSKVEAGKFEPKFEQVNVGDVAEACVNMVKPGAADQRISVRTDIMPDLPTVVADARSLKQILLNLLSNAVKFTEADGQVTVSAAMSDKGELILAVQDTGVGMSDEDLKRAFEPFGQARAATSQGPKGTGLGLPLAKALAEANRASLRVDSEPGNGTRVELAFPSTQVLQD